MLFVTICFAIPAFTLAHMPAKETGPVERGVLSASLLAFIVAGLFLLSLCAAPKLGAATGD